MKYKRDNNYFWRIENADSRTVTSGYNFQEIYALLLKLFVKLIPIVCCHVKQEVSYFFSE